MNVNLVNKLLFLDPVVSTPVNVGKVLNKLPFIVKKIPTWLLLF